MSKVFIDTSAYYAFLDRTDTSHPFAQSIFPRLFSDGTELYAPESYWARCGNSVPRHFFQSSMILIRVREADETTARAILHESDDKEYSYTDAVSFAAMDRLHIKEVFTFDHHFSQYGFQALS